VGILLGPFVVCLLAGITHGDGLAEPGLSVEETESAEFFDAYVAGFPPAPRPTAASGDRITSLESCGYRTDQIKIGKSDPVLEALAKRGPEETLDVRRFAALAIAKTTTGFGRRFLTACLRTPVYRRACEPVSANVVNNVSIIGEYGREHFFRERYGEPMCTYYDGLYARQRHLPGLPPTRFSTP
jgi:hypothetical protein